LCETRDREAETLPDLDKIKQLVEMMVTNDLVELTVRDGDLDIKLKRPAPCSGEMIAVPAVRPDVMQLPPAALPPSENNSAADVVDEDKDLLEITSPMVGTFYAGSDPESPPFAQVGTKISPSSVVCVLEAMKVFSEIKAELAGTIERVLVKNEQAVEFGQVLFLVRSD
jgi:acetyl-CoA carboxylase biotin carboxyl carrier protein